MLTHNVLPTAVIAILCLIAKQSQVAADYHLGIFVRNCTYDLITNFATDGEKCYLFRTSCAFREAKLKHIFGKKPKLFPTTKADCQSKCPKHCDEAPSTVCGEYRGYYTFFDSDCELNRIACIEGNYIRKVSNEKCYKQAYVLLERELEKKSEALNELKSMLEKMATLQQCY